MNHYEEHVWKDIGHPLACRCNGIVMFFAPDYEQGIGYRLDFTPRHIKVVEDLLEKLKAIKAEQEAKGIVDLANELVDEVVSP